MSGRTEQRPQEAPSQDDQALVDEVSDDLRQLRDAGHPVWPDRAAGGRALVQHVGHV
jgi:hypothetical protein